MITYHKQLMVISYANFKVNSELTRVHRWPHCHSNPVEVVVLLLHQVVVGQSREHTRYR